jgi:cyclophilin family peptidyl-prolyl cis-trans isomerase
MQNSRPARLKAATALLLMGAFVPAISNATIVEFDTNLGTIQVNLYDLGTPATVANFLAYVNNGDYTDSVVHRSLPGFVIQGGNAVTDQNANLSLITERPPVTNEPVFANVRGTIAMAKLPNFANSATSQWFFNLADNTANLDNANGGFTVFGEVVAGLDIVDAIAAVPTFNGVFGFNDFPLQNYTAPPILVNNYVIVNSITVIDTTVDSAAGLNPTPTTANNGGGGNGGGGGGGGGGSFGLLTLFALLVFGRSRYRRLTCR